MEEFCDIFGCYMIQQEWNMVVIQWKHNDVRVVDCVGNLTIVCIVCYVVYG
jgi:hypothetical protein